MAPNQKRLLEALEVCGGTRDAYGRVLASGLTHPAKTVLWCFLHGWIASDGNRVTLKLLGAQAVERERRRADASRSVVE